MRHARLKPDDRDTWHHCYNRAVGTSEDRPFDHADKEQFVRILYRVAAFYAVRIVSYQVMSNHWHILLQAPEEAPSEEETARRFEAFHHGRRTLQPGSKLCRDWQGRLRDVSWCMRHLQHLYTAYYRFCSYGVWARTGRHPFAEALSEVLTPALPEGLHPRDSTGLTRRPCGPS